MTTHFEYLDKWFSKSAFGNTNLKREILISSAQLRVL